jgi:GxxExxY protein
MLRRRLAEAPLTRSIIGAFFEVDNTLGYGFLEHGYKLALERELISLGHRVGRDVGVFVLYKGDVLTEQRIDMIVDGRVIVAVKATAQLPPFAQRQLYNYVRATRLEVGLLLHIGLEAEFYRVLNQHVRISQ